MSNFDKTVLGKVNKELNALFDQISEQYINSVKMLFDITERDYCEKTENICNTQSQAMKETLQHCLLRMNFDIGQELAAEEMAELMQKNRNQKQNNETTT